MYNHAKEPLWDQQPIDQRFSLDISLEPRRLPKRLMADQDLKLTPGEFALWLFLLPVDQTTIVLLAETPRDHLPTNPRLPMW